MTNSRIASALLAPALAAILAVACSSSDNNGGGATVGGNGGAVSSSKGGSGGGGPTVVTGDAACKDALVKVKACATTAPTAAQEKELLDACAAATSDCAKCVNDADKDCDAVGSCLIGEVCAPAPGGNGGASSGKGGTGGGGGTSSGKGGTGGTGGSQPVDPEECAAACEEEHADGFAAFNTFIVESCGCAAGAACATECGASCAAKSVDQACGTCLSNLSQGDACVTEVVTACQGDTGCTAALACLSGCDEGSGGSGGSGGGSGGQACLNECAMNNPDGIEKYNADVMGAKACLCDGATCKDKCAGSPLCTGGKPEASQACIDCQDECFGTCQADAACKKLFDCAQTCN